MTTSFEPPRIYVWDVVDRDGTGRSGVTGDPDAALQDVGLALAVAGTGASGTVRRVGLSPLGRAEYVDIEQIAAAHRDGTSVVWRLR
ncbi:hypothetical protein BJF79_21970 [Actinomadura sp. CNU-125]|uniref:hypothetical protein n=1 Tax=Actinomadura sp. CNU-125 TaxID=1904961 RepID=UPI000961B2F1|nr:hypothetical protein [Actinomadura sp. CNU-125]OLT12597.1 hypothetical protein BJF79_21970 [Actinomadura sp. CNU-125]